MNRRESWPDRPMDNEERRAVWDARYKQLVGFVPNTYQWKWLVNSKKIVERAGR
jgi:hypothetical protein